MILLVRIVINEPCPDKNIFLLGAGLIYYCFEYPSIEYGRIIINKRRDKVM
ncbi:hypothetical protein SAMN02746098_04308 [Desulfosporosinus lacus DSM 15449]|uniref:Uncharacterized protein n=1 Tax=Desulfosporosinus lacus DSM 15449 TaxID=1121420 RepID=A0A1M6C8M2_9FIRM|nr:hypothetical protein SAMN02746098_04308 [Desulfosporosinus lacus DSM 15449]